VVYGLATNESHYLSQCIVICIARDVHPFNERLFLSGIWIDSVTVSKCQHLLNIVDLLVEGATLNLKREGIEPSFLTASHPTVKPGAVLAVHARSIRAGYNGGLPGGLDKNIVFLDLVTAVA